MLLQTTIGHENWQTGSTKAHLFVCPTTQFRLPTGQEVHLWMLAKSGGPGSPRITSVGAPVTSPAGAGLKPEIVGKWTSSVYEVPDDVLLKYMVYRSTPQGARTASIPLRTRSEAALRRIAIQTIPNPRATASHLYVEGRFDILSVEDMVALGYRPPAHYLPTFRREVWGRLPFISVGEISPEIHAAVRVVTKTVRNSEGETVAIPEARRGRALDL